DQDQEIPVELRVEQQIINQQLARPFRIHALPSVKVVTLDLAFVCHTVLNDKIQPAITCPKLEVINIISNTTCSICGYETGEALLEIPAMQPVECYRAMTEPLKLCPYLKKVLIRGHPW